VLQREVAVAHGVKIRNHELTMAAA